MVEPQFNIRVVHNNLPKLKRTAPQKVGQIIRALAVEGVTHAKMLINESPASGREYRRGSVTHVASAPGEAPRSDTGDLIGSIHVEKGGRNKQLIVVDEEYAAPLEFGAEEINLEARPFMGPTVVYLEGIIEDKFDGFLED